MGIIVFSRLGGNFLLFLILARQLSLQDFGLFVVCFSVSSIFSMLVDYGLTQSLLHDIGGDPDSGKKHVAEGVYIKVVLSAVALLLVGIVSYVIFDDSRSRALLLALFLYSVANSFAEFYGTALRSVGRYREEAVVQFLYTVSVLLGLSFVGSGHESVLIVAAGLLIVKLIHLAVIKSLVDKVVGLRDGFYSEYGIWGSLRRGLPYAADVGVSNLLLNVDVLIVSYLLGGPAVAIYQAGQKIVQGYSSTAMIFSNVYLPRLSRLKNTDVVQFKKNAIQVWFLMALTGLFGLTALCVFSKEIVHLLYGERFSDLRNLLPLFGLLIGIRLVAAGVGVNLTALGFQGVRVSANVVSLLVVALTSWPLIDKYGVDGMVYSQLMAMAILLVVYGFSLAKGWHSALGHKADDSE